jgi:hypothetical protein
MLLHLFPREHGCQIPKLGLDFGGIGHSIRNLLPKKITISLAEPMNGDFERAL